MEVSKLNTKDILSLTPLQEGMLFHYLKNPNGEEYINQLEINIKSDLNKDLVQRAWQIVSDVHDALRTTFVWEKVKEPLQLILKKSEVQFSYNDLSNLNSEQLTNELQRIKRESVLIGRNLKGIPFIINLIKIKDRDCRLIITNHHILYDGWSNAIILEDFVKNYQALLNNEACKNENKGRFKDFILWQKSEDQKSALNFWQNSLMGYEEKLVFAGNSNKLKEQKSHGHYIYRLQDVVSDKLTQFAKKHGLTLASILYSAWGILLHKHSNSDDIVFGTTVSGRPTEVPNVNTTVGLFINTIPTRIQIKKGITNLDLVKSVFQQIIERKGYENFSLVKLQNLLKGSNSNLFDTILVFENYPLNKDLFNNKGFIIDSVAIEESTHYNLSVVVRESNGVEISYNYKTDVISDDDCQNINVQFCKIIEFLISDEDQDVINIDIITDVERKKILEDFNSTNALFPDNTSIVRLFEEQVLKSPKQIAITFKDTSLLYDELNKKANQLARFLVEKGVGKGDIVAIAVERSIEMMVGIFGILKAGAAYLPIDPNFPEKRIAYLLENSNSKLLLVHSVRYTQFEGKTPTFCIDDQEIYLKEDSNLALAISSDDPVYVIYTSGSTGDPKGVVIQHKALINRLYWMQNRYPINHTDTLLQKTTYTFDVSVWELFWWALFGSRLYILDPSFEKEPDRLADTIHRKGITVLHFVPSMLSAFLDYSNSSKLQDKLAGVKQVFASGEELKATHANMFYKVFTNSKLANLYGPTEAAIDVSYYDVEKNDIKTIIPIGKPIENIKLFIVNNNLQLQPIGIPGELLISGVGLAKGYINNLELTNQKFITKSAFTNDRLYKTGDLARWLPDGNIEFLGRLDHQIKLRGFRIECGEIENRLMEHSEIESALVLLKKSTNSEGELVAYYQADKPIEPQLLKSFLKERLPDYMVPTYFVSVEKMPLNSNGKIDRKVLMGIKYSNEVNKGSKPKNVVEQEMFNVWVSVLGHDNISTDINFFDVGGDSLKLIRLCSQIQLKFNVNIQIAELFNYPTIKSQTEFISSHKIKKEQGEKLVDADKCDDCQSDSNSEDFDIAIIGIAGRFPGARNHYEFWENLKSGKESISRESDKPHDANLIFAKGKLSEYDCFDASFFEYTPNEAYAMDPQIRLFHECAWEALEDAGINPFGYKGHIGLFAGASCNPLFNVSLGDNEIESLDEIWENVSYADKDYLCSRIAYKLNLKGPIVNINTACSTSLVAVDYAYNSLVQNKCDVAIAGGVSITFHDNDGYIYQNGRILSSDGHCRAFDKDADGTIGGNGVGVVVLKKLRRAIKDGDIIHAVIKGTAINNDGNQKVGFAAPSIAGQSEVIAKALKVARVNSESITYVEAHGTGTRLGDPVEFEGLKKAFNTSEKQFCGIGSVKTNIGHLDAAAGIAGLIKVVLSLKNKQIPPSLHFNAPNPEIDFINSPFFVNTKLIDWKNGTFPRRAGVSSFGIGGTNAHVIVEEAPIPTKEKIKPKSELFLFSAKSGNSLVDYSKGFIEFLEKNEEVNISDIAHTLQVGRAHFNYKNPIVADSKFDLINKLKSISQEITPSDFKREKIVFMFSGQGNQYSQMALELYNNSTFFKNELDKCFDIIKVVTKEDYKTYLFSDTSQVDVNETRYSQPLLFIVEYALAKYLIHLGISPDIMIGHSIGEYAAACISGVYSLEDTIKIVIKRGALMSSVARGSMISIQENIEQIRNIIPEDLSIATVNSQNNCVISGTDESIEKFQIELKKLNIPFVPLTTSHAFHSSMMDSILPEFENFVGQFKSSDPEIPIISNISGKMASADDLASPKYWSKHLRSTVNFYGGINEIYKENNCLFIEVGPGKSLTNNVNTIIGKDSGSISINMMRHPRENKNDYSLFLEQIGKLWSIGETINWENLAESKINKISLPTYSFRKTSFPVRFDNHNTKKQDRSRNSKLALKNWFAVSTWERGFSLNKIEDDRKEKFLVFGNSDIWSKKFKEAISIDHEMIFVDHDTHFIAEGKSSYRANYDKADDFALLFKELIKNNQFYTSIVYLSQTNINALTNQERLNRLANLINELSLSESSKEIRFNVVVDGIFEVLGDELLNPDNSFVMGPALVAQQENPNIKMRVIELSNAEIGSDRVFNHLIKELAYDFNDRVVALRNSYRWLPSYKNIESKETIVANEYFVKNGIYLITGGLGDIGFSIAEMLVNKYDARVVLTGRTEIDKLSEKSEIDPAKKGRIELIKSKQNSFIYCKANVSDYTEMLKVIETAEQKFGRINGVIHAAGVVSDDLSRCRISDIKIDNIKLQFDAKVEGTRVIEKIAESRNIDWVILMSSLSSILGGYGFTAYSAANAYLDTFSQYKNKESHTHWLSINWDGWSFGTETNEFISKFKDDVHLINKQEGLNAFESILSFGKINQVIVSLTDLNERLLKWTNIQTADKQAKQESLHERPDLLTQYVAPENEIQKKISEIWASFFGYNKIGINDDFFELGGDSLKVVSLTKLLREKLNYDFEIKDFIKNATVQKLSKLYNPNSGLKESIFEYPALEHDKDTHFDTFSLTPVQLAYLAGKGGNYELGNISTHGYIEIETKLEVKKLQNALNAVIQRHAALRMVLTNDGKQRFLEDIPEYIIEYEDLTNCTEVEINNKIEVQRNRLSHQIFDTFSWPLFEMKAIQISKEKLYLFVSIDIIIADANSLEIFASDLMHFYYKPEIVLDNLSFTFNDYMRGFNQVRASELYTRDKNYWLSKLDEFPYGTGLPLKNLSNEVVSPKFSRFEKVLDKEQWLKIKSLAASNNITPSVFMGTAFASVLSYWSNQDLIGVNLTFFNRMPFHKDVTKMIGDFTSLVILGINYNASLNFYENALKFQEQLFDAIEHKHFDGVEFIGELRKFNKLGNKAVMPIVFTSTLNESEHFDSSFWNNFGEIKKSITQTPQVYLDHQLRLQQGKLFLVWDYVEQMFDNVFIENMFNSYINLLNDLLQDKSPSLPDSDNLIVTQENKYNSTQQHFEFELLDKLFERKSVQFGKKIAVVDKHAEITFEELEKKSNSVANYLIENGIKPNTLVGVLAQRNINTIINVLGIQKAGGAYVPIDPNQPEKRNAIVIKNCEINIILDSDKANEIVGKYSTELPDITRKLDDLAYVIHTSGSTGIPKGVMINHLEAVNTILDINDKFNVSDSDSILGISSLCFDLSVYDIFGAFASGATLNLLEDPRNISEYKNKLTTGITIWNSVPALLEMFIKGVDQDYVNTTVRLILLSGDWIPLYLVGKAEMHFPNAKIISLGGATEGSIWSIYYPITKVEKDWKSIPYGYPLANQQMYVLSKWLDLCPVDVKGEIYIGGMGVANGYLNDVVKTDNAYISHPKFGKIYKTGDQGVFRKEGYIEFLGRVDHQVKVRGYRIELGEIENAIQKHERIKQCRAIVKEIEDEKYIVCYIVADELIDVEDIKTYASEKLPSYMVPSYIQQIDNIPLTSNGKVDIKNLPEIEHTKKTVNVRPKDSKEFRLLEIYSQVLNKNIENISLDEPITNLGVSSIKIVEIYQKITKEFDIEINIAELFKYQTIGEYALYFKEQLDRKLPEEDDGLSENIRKNRSDNKKLQFNKRKQLR